MGRFWDVIQASKAYVIMIVNTLCVSIFMIMLQSLLSNGVSSLVFVVYQHLISSVVLSFLAYFLEKKKRPPLSFKILCYTFLLGFLQITLCQLMLTMSLQYVASTYQSIAINLIPLIVFVLALIFRQEKLEFWSINGQAKLSGVVLSVAGALATVLWKGPMLLNSSLSTNYSDAVIGGSMLAVAVLSTSFVFILLVHVMRIYPADLSIAAMMANFGTIQTLPVVLVCVKSKSAWELKWDGGLVLAALLLGGLVTTGFAYYTFTWCVKTKGPVFTSAFNPLIILFSFLLEIFVLGADVRLGRIVGAVLVVSGLYLLLWSKSRDEKTKEEVVFYESINSRLIQP